jgi:hypothetical protein
MQDIFTGKYENCAWGNNENPQYKGSSGGGSEIGFNQNTYIPVLKKFINDNSIKTVVDLGCGDFVCGPLIYNDLDVLYTGYDAYNGVIQYNQSILSAPKYTFIHLDFFTKKEEIVDADLCILKDVLQHWDLKSIYEFLDYIVEHKKFKYILVSNCSFQRVDNTDIITGNIHHLNSNYFPLKKYGAVEIFRYSTKQVSVIDVSRI